MHHTSTHLLLQDARQRELQQAAQDDRAARLLRLRQRDRRSRQTANRTRLLRLTLG